MIIKRIRQSALRRRRSIERLQAVIVALTTYSVDANPELLEALARESRAAHYVLDTEASEQLGIEPGEKVHSHGSRNLVGRNLVQHQQEMLAACLLAPGAKDPIEHYVVSWGAGDVPNDKQIDEVVDIFAAEMGFGGCQIQWAVHSNTMHRHLHLVVNRVDAEKRAVISPGEGWEIERLHQVIALIEQRQGWASEPNALYRAQDEVIYDRATEKIVRRADGSRDGCYKRKVTSPEKGQAPEHDKILRVLQTATGWREIHYCLAQEDAAYITKGSGAEIRIGGQRMPASDFGREFAFGKMEARLGPYEPDLISERDPHESYQAALRDERARLRDALNDALGELRRRRALTLKQARRPDHNQFQQAMTEQRIQLAFDQAEKGIKHEFDLVRRTIAASYMNRERWYRAGQPAASAVKLPEMIYGGDDAHNRVIKEQHGFTSKPHAAGADYVDEAGARAFSDYGLILLVYQVDLKAIEAAMELASQRAEAIQILGSPAFVEACRAIGGSRGFHVIGEDGKRLSFHPQASNPSNSSKETNSAPIETRSDERRIVESPLTHDHFGGQPSGAAKMPLSPSVSSPIEQTASPEPGADAELVEFWKKHRGRQGAAI